MKAFVIKSKRYDEFNDGCRKLRKKSKDRKRQIISLEVRKSGKQDLDGFTWESTMYLT